MSEPLKVKYISFWLGEAWANPDIVLRKIMQFCNHTWIDSEKDEMITIPIAIVEERNDED